MGPFASQVANIKLHYMLERFGLCHSVSPFLVSPSFRRVFSATKCACESSQTGKILHYYANQQETSLFSTLEGSSETNTWRNSISANAGLLPPLRHKNVNNSLDKAFIQWFVGFSEGDGSFGFSCQTGQSHFRHDFIINQKDPQVLYKIRSTLGFGTVKHYNDFKQGTSYHRYIVSDIEGIFKLIQIFNGQLILNKTRLRYTEWCNTFFKRPQVIKIGFSLRPLRDRLEHLSHCSLDTAWLSGFIDAEGCFNAGFDSSTLRSKIRLRFILDQKDESVFLESIISLFNSGLIQSRKECHNMQRYVLELSIPIDPIKRTKVPKFTIGFERLFTYLNKFPLKSKKHISYVRFKKVWIRLHDDRVRDGRSLMRLHTLVSSINKDFTI